MGVTQKLESKYFANIERIHENASHGIILSQITPGSMVLECGCATGYMTRYMKEALDAKVSIVELNPSDYDQAKKYAADGICTDLESREWWDYYQGRKFDYILFADVLEHLRNPERVLKWAVDLLKEDGTIIASIPNVAHADILVNLLNGRWNYTPLGLLDNTHIHFWAEKNLDGLFRQAGLTVVEQDYTILSPFTTEQKSEENILGLLPAIYTLCHQPFADVYQFVFSAKKMDFVRETGIVCTDHYTERHAAYWIEPPCCSEYLKAQNQLAAQHEEREELIRFQQRQIDQLAELSRTQEQTIREQQAHIGQLAEQSRMQEQTIRNRQAYVAQLEAQNQDLTETAEARQARIEQFEAQTGDLTALAEARQAHIEQLEAQNRYLSESFDIISNAFFWKITKPARFTLDVMKWAARPHAEKGLMRKGLYSLKANGPRITWQKAMQKIYYEDSLAHVAKQALFTEEELAQQRKRRFSKDVKFSIVVPLYNTPERFLREMIESVQAQTYGGWELCMADGSDAQHGEVTRICREYVRKDKRIRYRKLEKNLGISGNTNACLEMATGDYIGLFDHDDLLHPAALYEVMRTIENTGADFIYTDESTFHETPEDAYLPHFKPDFAPDNLRANNYICHFTVFKRALLDETGFFDPACDGSQDHDMVLRLTEKARRVAHIPEILYYWRAHAGSVAESAGVKPYTIEAGVRAVKKQLEQLGLEGQVEPVGPGLTIYRTRYAIKGTPKISILIPNYEHIEELRNCLDSIFDKTTWPNYELVIVENNSRSQELFHYYERVQQEHTNVRVVTWEGTFNYSAVNNYGAQFCTGEYLLLLNNDIEVITPDWIQEMLMFAQRPDVGAVGAKLYYPDKTIQHAGVCLGMGGVAGHYFQHVDYKNVGYVGRLLYPQDMTAVTAACMLLRREVWEKLGGLDEDWAVAFNDVDLCMRIRKAGYLIVWTPFAELYHLESKSRGIEDTPEKQVRFNQEVRQFQTRWAKELEVGDPYYNPNFSLARSDFFADNIRQHDAR